MLRKLITLIAIILLCNSIAAKHSDDYLIGNYSYWCSWNKNGLPYLSTRATAFGHMKTLGYNSTVCNTYNGDQDLDDMLEALDSDSLDAILTDFSWDALQTDAKYSTRGLSLSNFQKFEAEFSSDSLVVDHDATKHDFYYCSRREGGNRFGKKYAEPNPDNASKGFVWKCEKQTPPVGGYVLNDLTYRWNKPGVTTPEYLNQEFQFNMSYDNATTDYMLQHTYLYFDFAFKLTNLGAWEGENLLKFKICGRKWVDGAISNQISVIPHFNVTTNVVYDSTIVTQYKYLNPYNYIPPVNGYTIIRLAVKLQDLQDYLIPGSGKYMLSNIFPKVWWYGNSDLKLDYVDVYDNIHMDMNNNETLYGQKINNRINELKAMAPDNIKYMYSFDEPNQPQFDSYRVVQNAISSVNPTNVSAIYDWRRDMVKSSQNGIPATDKYYQHPQAFLDQVTDVKVFSPDLYPIRPEVVWDTATDANFVQTKLNDNLLAQYDSYARECQGHPNRSFIPVVQAFGAWDRLHNRWVSWLRPPAATQKMLQYLPLCYGADGIINYLATSWVKSGYNPSDTETYQFGPINIDKDNGAFSLTSNYAALQEANAKIKVYGKLIKPLEWISAETLMMYTYPANLDMNLLQLDNLEILEPADQMFYKGYVQCGAYMGNNEPSFMLVNRRANFSYVPGPVSGDNSVLDDCFLEPGSQTVRFRHSEMVNEVYGIGVGLFDPYAQTLYSATNREIDVTLTAGDGKYLQMVATPPAVISSQITIPHRTVIDGVVTIASGGSLDFTSNAEVALLANSKIVVSTGGILNLTSAQCTFGLNASIEVNGGTLNVDGCALSNSSYVSRWNGITATSGSVVNLTNSVLSNAFKNTITNSNLYVTNCRFNIPAITGAIGLLISNPQAGHHSEIIATEANVGFYSSTGSAAIGILLGKIKNRVIIVSQAFQDLSIGIYKEGDIYAADSIAYSTFTNCATGFQTLCSGYKGKIEQCSFIGNNRGIWLTAALTCVNACSFEACTSGIFAEYSPSKTNASTGIFASTFTGCDAGIESRNASYKVKNNFFDMSQVGILNHEDSNLNLSYNSQNVMKNTLSNIEFCGLKEDPYKSKIQLYTGHNDFYHEQDLESGYNVKDFTFDSNFYSGMDVPSFFIDASMNWFQDFTVRVNKDEYEDYVYVGEYDSEPNVPLEFGEERFLMALGYEAQGNYVQAIAIFKSMLDEELESEKLYLTSAADGVYRLSNAISDPSWVATAYLDTKVTQYSTSDSTLSALLKNYQTKVFVSEKDYQNAINNIQLRISTPVSELDSLLAVLDLEIVLQLAAMEESKRPLATMYAEYKYPDVQTFERKHDEHWAELYRLLNKGDEPAVPIPTKPIITSNYPNPFNPSTTLTFSVPRKGIAKLSVYNLKGQKVKQLIDGELAKGHHKIVWDGVDENKKPVASGIYFIRLEAGNQTNVHKVMLMK